MGWAGSLLARGFIDLSDIVSKSRISVTVAISQVVSILAGAFSIFAVVLRFLPALDDVRHMKEAVDLYTDYIRDPLLRLVGIPVGGSEGAAGLLIDAVIFWIAFFVAVNVFTLKREGWLLASHIKANYCQLRRAGFWSSLPCVAPKLLVAFLVAPLVCVGYALTKLSAPRDRLYSAGYITIQPREILHYLLLMFGTVAALLLLAHQLAGLL